MTVEQWQTCQSITADMQAAKSRMLKAEEVVNHEKRLMREMQASCPHLVTRSQSAGPEGSSRWCVICKSEID